MNRKIIYLIFTTVIFITGCEEVIQPELESADPILVVDAWLTHESSEQQIILTRTQPYFDSALPAGVSGASVQVTDQNGKVYAFTETETGVYSWMPTGSEVFGELNLNYNLQVVFNNETFVAESKLGEVPPVDSITFFLTAGSQLIPDLYQAEFWAIDPIDPGNAYWIKTYKNGQLLNKPSEILTSYDGGFSKGSGFNGADFIPPIRRGINPFDEDEDGSFLSPYVVGDSVYVEILSITEATFNFLNEVSLQTNRPGGFGELFATPLANVRSNIRNLNSSGSPVVGFFNVGARSGFGRKFKSLDEVTRVE